MSKMTNGRGKPTLFPTNGITVHEHEDGGFTVARGGMWWPGVYASHSAAVAATRHDPAEVEALWHTKDRLTARLDADDLRGLG